VLGMASFTLPFEFSNMSFSPPPCTLNYWEELSHDYRHRGAVDAEERHVEQTKVLSSIQRRRFKAPKDAPPSLELLREDRGR
jgi:hypothetical protein